MTAELRRKSMLLAKLLAENPLLTEFEARRELGLADDGDRQTDSPRGTEIPENDDDESDDGDPGDWNDVFSDN